MVLSQSLPVYPCRECLTLVARFVSSSRCTLALLLCYISVRVRTVLNSYCGLPNKQAQVYEAGMLRQRPPFLHGDVTHSSISSSHNCPVHPVSKKTIHFRTVEIDLHNLVVNYIIKMQTLGTTAEERKSRPFLAFASVFAYRIVANGGIDFAIIT